MQRRRESIKINQTLIHHLLFTAHCLLFTAYCSPFTAYCLLMTPFFSIIVPTHGRDAALHRCLEALDRLDYPPERYEIIVVYDGDSPAQPPTLENRPLQILSQPKSGPAAARNRGAAQAEGEYLAFTDDDCFPAADWLHQLSAALEKFPERMVGGRIINALPDNNYAAATQLLVDFLYEQYNPDPLQAQFFNANNMALKRDLFITLGGFDARFSLPAGEDRELCRRWLHTGRRMFYQPAAVVHHAHPLTPARFWQQHLNYGRGAFHFRHLQARQQNSRLKLESASFYLNLLRYPFRQTNGRAAPHLFPLFLIMQTANTFGFLQEGFRLVQSHRLNQSSSK